MTSVHQLEVGAQVERPPIISTPSAGLHVQRRVAVTAAI
jgi:hypothetical protein